MQTENVVKQNEEEKSLNLLAAYPNSKRYAPQCMCYATSVPTSDGCIKNTKCLKPSPKQHREIDVKLPVQVSVGPRSDN